MNNANRYPLNDEQETLLMDFICREVNRGYKVGFIHGFAAALLGAVAFIYFG